MFDEERARVDVREEGGLGDEVVVLAVDFARAGGAGGMGDAEPEFIGVFGEEAFEESAFANAGRP